ncbi:MAG: type II secretion system protein [Deltaproteobacteria bacterium]|nr:type II secretion system protein [Deltaproteobacteria bacterium]
MNFDHKGFTLIELVLVIAILGVLAVSALPNIFDISLTAARNNARDGVVGAIQSGLSLYAANQIASGSAESYPTLLETSDLADATAAERTVPLFNQVLQNGVTSQWFKIDDDCYAFDTNGNGALNQGTDVEYQYTSASGTFLGVADCG